MRGQWVAVPFVGTCLLVGHGCAILPEAPAVEEAIVYPVGGAVTCTDLEAGERFVSTSPEGHGWLVSINGQQSVLRVEDPFVEGRSLVHVLDVPDVRQVRAWGESEATLLTPRTVWQLSPGFVRTRVSTPEGFAGAASSCGDLWLDGYVALDDRLVRHRSGAVFSWAFGADGALPEALLPRDGACVGPDGVLWGIESDGTMWTVDDRGADQSVSVAGWSTAAASADQVGVLANGLVWLGGRFGWNAYTLGGEPPHALAAGGTDLWMGSDDTLVRYRGGVFVSVESPLSEPLVELSAHASGVWAIGVSEACHVALAPAIRISDIRPQTRTRTGEYSFGVTVVVPPDDGSGVEVPEPKELVATLDGEPYTLTPDPKTGAIQLQGTLVNDGWHTFRLEAGPALRDVYVERTPAIVERTWDGDIEPLFQASCDGAGCHAAGAKSPTDLSTQQAWLQNADAIRQRVVVGESMPPPAAREGWGSAQVEIVSEWLEGGMRP